MCYSTVGNHGRYVGIQGAGPLLVDGPLVRGCPGGQAPLGSFITILQECLHLNLANDASRLGGNDLLTGALVGCLRGGRCIAAWALPQALSGSPHRWL